ncbi:MAG: peroxiredoxin family protein, partial [Phenylobacterium sp.]
MMRAWRWAAGLAVGIGLALGAQAVASSPQPASVDDFVLPDQDYLARQLYRLSDAKAVVLITYASGDATVRREAAAYAALRSPGVEVMMLASRLGERRETVNPQLRALGLNMPVLFDYQQLAGEQLGVTRAGEVIVVDPRSWTVAWRGALTGPRGEPWAATAIADVAAGRTPTTPTR